MRHLLIFLIIVLFSSCETKSELFSGNFVKGKVISKARGSVLGFVEMTKGNDTYPSFLATYKASEAPNLEEDKEYFFKVSDQNGIPIASNFVDALSGGEVAFNERNVPHTSIDTHSFYGHVHDSQKHIKMHLIKVSEEINGFYKFKGTDEDGVSNPQYFFGKKDILFRMEDMGGDIFYITNDEDIIVDIDTCHYHGLNPQVCRSNSTDPH